MFKNKDQLCASCTINVGLIGLDCSHTLCLECLGKQINKNEQRQMLVDELQLTCRCCDVFTYLPVALAYKIVKNITTKSQEPQVMPDLICKDCIKMLSVSEYLSGKHRNHDVRQLMKEGRFLHSGIVEKERKIEQNLSFHEGQRKMLQNLKTIQLEKIEQKMENIRLQFSKLKEILQQRQSKLLEQYQEVAEEQLVFFNNQIYSLQTILQEGLKQLKLCNQQSRKKLTNKKHVFEMAVFLEHFQHHPSPFALRKNIKSIQIQQLQRVNLMNISKQHIHKIAASILDISLVEKCAHKGSHLDFQYFQGKRRSVLDPSQNSQLLKVIGQKQRNDPSLLKMESLRQIWSGKQPKNKLNPCWL